jgi:ferric-dicitrate binding protein FerR (iron transport regulator)
VREGRVQLEATNVPLQAIIKGLAAATGAKIAIDPAVGNQRITIKITDQPLNEALKMLTEPHGLEVEPAGEWQIIKPKG